MSRAEGEVYGNPDDPYTTRSYFDAEGNLHIVVSADVLTGGDTTEVQAELQRRAGLYQEWLDQWADDLDSGPET